MTRARASVPEVPLVSEIPLRGSFRKRSSPSKLVRGASASGLVPYSGLALDGSTLFSILFSTLFSIRCCNSAQRGPAAVIPAGSYTSVTSQGTLAATLLQRLFNSLQCNSSAKSTLSAGATCAPPIDAECLALCTSRPDASSAPMHHPAACNTNYANDESDDVAHVSARSELNSVDRTKPTDGELAE